MNLGTQVLEPRLSATALFSRRRNTRARIAVQKDALKAGLGTSFEVQESEPMEPFRRK